MPLVMHESMSLCIQRAGIVCPGAACRAPAQAALQSSAPAHVLHTSCVAPQGLGVWAGLKQINEGCNHDLLPV